MTLFPRLRIIERALEAITAAMVTARSGYLPINDVLVLFESLHASNNQTEQSLFFQLENEGVLTVEPVIEGQIATEMVRFTFEQIGRASCRESVCQYVLISVGGGSLKKKNKKN